MAGLTLNDATVPFKEFYGANHKQMPRLIKEGRIPLSIAGLAERRLEVLASDSEEVRSAWMDNYFDTGDGVFYHPNGNLKVVLGARPIRDLNPDSHLSREALELDQDRDASIEVYDALEGPEFTRKDLEGKTDKVLSRQEAKDHPVWEALIPDKALREGYIDAMFDQGEKRFRYNNLMEVRIDSPQNIATGRLWFVSYLNNYAYISGLGGIDGDCGRLVGVAPEAQSAHDTRIVAPTLEQTLAVVGSRDLSDNEKERQIRELYKQ